MIIEIKIPSPGESISEVEIARWLVEDGSYVEKNQEIAEVESDKATLSLVAESEGKIKIVSAPGSMVKVGAVACTIDTGFIQETKPVPEIKNEVIAPAEKSGLKEETVVSVSKTIPKQEQKNNAKVTPLAQKLMDENNLNIDDIINGLKKITTHEVNHVVQTSSIQKSEPKQMSRQVSREKMSQLRRKISERLVEVKNQTAMLTTFNEVDMSAIIELRNKHQKAFQEKYGVKLGLMSFFTKAVSVALGEFPRLNSFIEGDEIVKPDYCDIGIAVQSEKGLMVPILRNAETLTISQIELQIAELAKKARNYKITPGEMSGGTFTITNGGIFGSLLSTPIINPPQSGILGMHNIVDRPVAINNQVVIRPMMYVALSYDHRIVDGKDSVSFLMRVKELIESPLKLLIAGSNPDKALLGL